MREYDIAIVGAGIAGLAAAAFLARDGHRVTVHERFDAPKPVGAGLLLQPTGLSVLALLGLDEQAIALGSRIERLYGRGARSSRATLDVHYRDLHPQWFGLGIHRASLFNLLHQAALKNGACIRAAQEIASTRPEGVKEMLVSTSGEVSGPYDLVIDASGAKSLLRGRHAAIKKNRAYPYGAIWAVVKDTGGNFAPDRLEQRYEFAWHMIGVLPLGRLNGEPHQSVAFFWSLKVEDYAKWRLRKMDDWQDYVINLWPETEPLVRQLGHHDDLTLASYSDIALRKPHAGRILFMGDAAHCTSPQLGQGANLALMDAMALALALRESENSAQAFALYARQRASHTRFYQWASRTLTPLFQSDGLFFASLRALLCIPSCRFRFSRQIAAHVLSGTKTGFFSTLNPGAWAKRYELYEDEAPPQAESSPGPEA